jgi:hypothetical protein
MKFSFSLGSTLIWAGGVVAICAVVGPACRVDNSGLGEMTIVSRDGGAGTGVVMGTAGETGAAGMMEPVTGAAGEMMMVGTAGVDGLAGAGAAGDMTSGAAGAGGAGAGTAGMSGDAGTSGAAGEGVAGAGAAGVTGAAGVVGTAGMGAAGNGAAGMGAAGMGAAGMGVAGTGAAGKGAAGMGAAGMGPAPCGPATCPTGCCGSDGHCVAGRTVDRCGSGGLACATCNNCELCSATGVCTINPSSDWGVVCDSAIVATSPPGGGTWDPHAGQVGGTAPDPFCQFEMPANTVTGLAAATITDQDTFTPTWNETVLPAGKTVKASDLMSTSKTWRLWVGDDDGCTAQAGCVGAEICELDQPLPASALLTGQLVKQNVASCVSLTVSFVCAD